MKLLFVSHAEKDDRSAWSGIPYNLSQRIEPLADLVYVQVPIPERTLMRKVADKAQRIATRKHTAFYWSQKALQSYRQGMVEAIEREQPDAVLSTHTMLLWGSEGNCRRYAYTDATYEQLCRLYPFFVNKIGARDKARSIAAEKQIAMHLDGIIVSSEWAKQGFVEYGVAPDKVSVVKFGANVRGFESAEVEHAISARLLALREGRKAECIFVGKEWDRKRGAVAVAIVRELRNRGYDANLHVFGSLPREECAKDTFVVFHGQTASMQGSNPLAEWLAKSTLHVFPSSADCTPLAIAEASAYAVPTVATDSGGVSAMLMDGKNGRLLPLSASVGDLADAAMEILDGYEYFARGAYGAFEAELNWKSCASQIFTLVEPWCVKEPIDASSSRRT